MRVGVYLSASKHESKNCTHVAMESSAETENRHQRFSMDSRTATVWVATL